MKGIPCPKPAPSSSKVATRLFAEKGFHGVSVREIASAAGINLSMISYYFKGKEGLYATVLNEQFAVLHEVAGIAGVEADPLEKIRLYVTGAVDRHRKNPHLVKFYTSELTNPTPYFETIVKPAIQCVFHTLHGILTDATSAKVFRSEVDPKWTSMALAGMVLSQYLFEPATRELVDRSPDGDEKLALRVMDIFIRGCCHSS